MYAKLIVIQINKWKKKKLNLFSWLKNVQHNISFKPLYIYILRILEADFANYFEFKSNRTAIHFEKQYWLMS